MQVGLWLNIPRILMQPAVSTQRGIHAAFSYDPLDRAHYEAAATLPEQVDALKAAGNMQRLHAKIWADRRD